MESAPGTAPGAEPQQPEQRIAACRPHGPTPRPASAESFLAATCIAWGHLQPAERKAIRACCRAGRLQHDSLLTDLKLTLGMSSALEEHNYSAPTLSELRASLEAVVDRGARLQSLTVQFHNPGGGWMEHKMLAALEACSGCPLSRLELWGAVPLTPRTAQAVEVWCPQLCSLILDQACYPWYYEEPYDEPAFSSFHEGCAQLLQRCGPRLRTLQLHGVHAWRAASYMCLRHCTALTDLDLEVRWMSSQYALGGQEEHWVEGAPELESYVYEAVSHIKTLRTLHLSTELDPKWSNDYNLSPYADAPALLSALTALTRLTLERSQCYEHDGDVYQEYEDEADRERWFQIREAHRTSLLSALRCMPQLQHLDCPTLWLQPSEAASLTALTSLTMQGMLPPATAQHHASEPAAADPSADGIPPAASTSGSLPPQLQELSLHFSVSVRVLALLRPPASLRGWAPEGIRFGALDVDVEGRVTAEAVDAVGPAVRVLLDSRGESSDSGCAGRVCVACNSGLDRLLPREGAHGGHSEWIRRLQGLDAFGTVALSGLELRTADMCCLGHTLCNLKSLHLIRCSFPLPALPAMRAHMPQLQQLELGLRYVRGVDESALGSALVLVCRPHHGAVQLRHITCYACPSSVDREACRQAVLQQLQGDFGVTGVTVVMC